MAILKVLKNKKEKSSSEKDSKKPSFEAKSETKKTIKKTERAFVPYVMKKPWISEKAARLTAENQYVFEVVKNANKNAVKKEIESRYNVTVERVNIINRPAKTKRFGSRIGLGETVKKAIVKVKAGDKIEII